MRKKCIKDNSDVVNKIERDFGIILSEKDDNDEVNNDISNEDTLSSISQLLLQMERRNNELALEVKYQKARFHMSNKEHRIAKVLLEEVLVLHRFEIYRDYVCVLYDMKMYDTLKPYLRLALDIKPNAPWLNTIHNEVFNKKNNLNKKTI